jgi:CheY-like chemotaxis protein
MASTRKEPVILVIDASLTILNLYHEVLEEQGYEVELSNYAFESVSMVERLQPDLIIMDFDREGQREEWQLLKLLKLHPATASIPILLSMAPLQLHPHWEEHLQRNNIRLLLSPVGKEQLLAVIRQVLASASE